MTTTQETLYPSRTVMVGVTLSEEWYNFPYLLMPDFSPFYWYEKLDVELPLYVSWIMDYDHRGARTIQCIWTRRNYSRRFPGSPENTTGSSFTTWFKA